MKYIILLPLFFLASCEFKKEAESKLDSELFSFSDLPPQLYFDEDLELKDNRSFRAGKIFFQPNILIVTNGFKLEFFANEVFFDETRIIAFSKSKAKCGKPGLDAGSLEMNFKKIFGLFQISLDAQDGGNSGHICGNKKRNGNGGNGGVVNINYNDISSNLLNVSTKPGKEGKASRFRAAGTDFDLGSPGVDGQPGSVCINSVCVTSI